MAAENAGIRVQEATTCFLCGGVGTQLYGDLSDRLLDAPGSWNLRCCKVCEVTWLDPQPLPDDIGKLYGNYYTHQPSEKWQPGSIRWKLRQAVQGAMFGFANYPSTWLWRLFGITVGRLSAP
ncbi:MAG: hypothetical protein ABSF46_32635 [Terriglobia bacterium]|jgi:hypothetical protein